MTFENTPTLAAYANDVANAAKIVADRHVIPEQLNGQAFLGARSPIPGDNTSFVWRLGGPASLLGLRHHLSSTRAAAATPARRRPASTTSIRGLVRRRRSRAS